MENGSLQSTSRHIVACVSSVENDSRGISMQKMMLFESAIAVRIAFIDADALLIMNPTYTFFDGLSPGPKKVGTLCVRVCNAYHFYK